MWQSRSTLVRLGRGCRARAAGARDDASLPRRSRGAGRNLRSVPRPGFTARRFRCPREPRSGGGRQRPFRRAGARPRGRNTRGTTPGRLPPDDSPSPAAFRFRSRVAAPSGAPAVSRFFILEEGVPVTVRDPAGRSMVQVMTSDAPSARPDSASTPVLEARALSVSGTARWRPSRVSTFASGRRRSTACWARTAPGRRPPFTFSWASSSRRAGACT